MVWLFQQQDRDSIPNWYTINYPTTLQAHNETQWPTAACRWQFALRDYFLKNKIIFPEWIDFNVQTRKHYMNNQLMQYEKFDVCYSCDEVEIETSSQKEIWIYVTIKSS